MQGIGIYDNFFELEATRSWQVWMIARIRKSLCVDVAMRSLFEEPTLAGLAVAVKKARANGVVPRVPILRRHEHSRRSWTVAGAPKRIIG